MGKIDNKTIDRLVFNLRNPGRYIGCELNQVKKDNPIIKMAISYPDLYEIGMSNNGLKILYDIVNNISGVSCERVFAVPDDFEKKIREMKIPLYTLETYTPLCELDIIGFNVAYELLFTNILQILDLGYIPLLSKDRGDGLPIVIAGGESVSNPLPISDFIDAFFIGDGEEGTIDIVNIIRISKSESLKRFETIGLLSEIDGIYIPAKKKKFIKKRIVRADAFYNPSNTIIPNLRITQERHILEVTRGCKNLCNFCHSGYYGLPYRRGKAEILRDQILILLENSYYSELTLSSLSISDYYHLVKLLNLILPELIERGISISLPSLRVDKRTLPIIKQISDLRKTSLTFAIESGCEEIRNIANKKLKIDDILSIAENIFNSGWNLLKLYFMIGLPGCEEYDEAEPIIELLKDIQKTGGKRLNLNVTISPFVPKPHTPFQWEKQMSIEYFTETIARIRRSLPRQVSVKAHDVYASVLEGVMSRGDSELNKVIYNSYIEGCRLDSWKEHFNFQIWEKNLNEIPDWRKYLRAKAESEVLPWSFISTGFEKLIKSQRNRINILPKNIMEKAFADEIDSPAIKKAFDSFKRKYSVEKRIRIKFEKKDKAKYISHLDFIGIIIRGLRMIGAPVSFTQGFNKRERISMGFPLPVGIESICELCDIDLYDDMDIETISKNLSLKLPEGISATSAAYLDTRKSIMSITTAAEFSIKIEDYDLESKFIRNLQIKRGFIKDTKQGKKKIQFDRVILAYDINNNTSTGQKEIIVRISMGSENSIRIDNIALNLSEADYDDFYKFNIIKLCQYKKENNEFKEIN